MRNIIKNIPNKPGCYIYKDTNDTILYIGKAKKLRTRVQSYFNGKNKWSVWTHKMVPQIDNIEYIEVSNNIEALILENNLIKQHKPRYNILLKDDKSFVYIKIHTTEQFPRITIVRRPTKDKNLYFGPYTSANRIKKLLQFLRGIFPYRTCRMSIVIEEKKTQLKNIDRNTPCLDYHIKKCGAPCTALTTPEEYQHTIDGIVSFLKGNTWEILKILKNKMMELATQQLFEEAAKIKEQYQIIQEIEEKQKLEHVDTIARDIIWFYQEGDIISFAVFQIREGKLIQRENFQVHSQTNEHKKEDLQIIIQQFLLRYYSEVISYPKEVLLPLDIPELEDTQQALCDITKTSLWIKTPKRGEKLDLITLASQNAQNYAKEQKASFERSYIGNKKIVNNIKSKLSITQKQEVSRMECYDISHLSGTHTVASQVVFIDGQPSKKDYRHYKIDTLQEWEINDFKSMKEVLTRRLKNYGKDNFIRPDFILIDGWKGQLSSVAQVFEEYGIDPYKDIFLCSIAKREEEIFTVDQSDPIMFEKGTDELRLLQHMRDESHRFAITHNRNSRIKAAKKSVLDTIPGIGWVTKKKLLTHFWSLDGIRNASDDELQALVGEKIWKGLRENI